MIKKIESDILRTIWENKFGFEVHVYGIVPKKLVLEHLQEIHKGCSTERVAIDVAGPFSKSSSGNRYTLIIMDYLSKWPAIAALPIQEARFLSDQGRNL